MRYTFEPFHSSNTRETPAMRATMFVAAFALAGCASSAPQGNDSAKMASDMAAITKVRDGYAAAWKAGDGAALSSFYTADARSMENNVPTAVGPQGAQTSYTAFTSQFTPVELT